MFDFWPLMLGEGIGDTVFDNLEPQDLYALRATSHAGQDVVEEYLERRFNITRTLSPYFDSVPNFRAIQARTATLVSGSTALQFMDRTTYPNSDLDLYLFRRHVPLVIAFLEHEGYQYFERREGLTTWEHALHDAGQEHDAHLQLQEPHYVDNTIFCVLDFKMTRNGVVKIVQLIVAMSSPMECILNFHSSKSINVTDRII